MLLEPEAVRRENAVSPRRAQCVLCTLARTTWKASTGGIIDRHTCVRAWVVSVHRRAHASLSYGENYSTYTNAAIRTLGGSSSGVVEMYLSIALPLFATLSCTVTTLVTSLETNNAG